jgi:hypothetical protein
VRRAALVTAPLLAALAVPAGAAPTAAPAQGATASVDLVGGGKVQRLALLVTTPQQGRPQLRLRLTPPSGAVQRWYGELAPSAVTSTGDALDGTTTLRTRVGGVPLVVVWSIEPGALMVSTGNLDGDDASAEGWSMVGPGGTVDVTLGSARCRVEMGAVGPAVTYDTNGYGRPLSTRLPLAKGTRCREVPSSLPTVP